MHFCVSLKCAIHLGYGGKRGLGAERGRFGYNAIGMSEIAHEYVEILRPLMQCQGHKHLNSRFESDACRKKNNS